jgi:uncharacterized membrane protein
VSYDSRVIVPALLLVAGYAALVLLLRPLAGRAAVWPLLEPLPFALLGAAGIVLHTRWEEIPPRFAIHFAFDGRPDGWAPRTPGAVFAPLAIGAAAVVLLLLVRAAVAAIRSGDLGTPPAASSRRFAGGMFLGVEAFVAGLTATASFLALGATLRQVLGVALGGLVLLVVALGASLAALSRRAPDEGGAAAGGWRAGGLVYRDAGDPDLWIPKRIGIGWTLNFGHPAAWWVLALLILAPIAVVGTIFFVATSR